MKAGRPSKYPRSQLGSRIAEAREQAGLSQAELACSMGISQQLVATWERKASSLRTANLIKLSKVLSISTDELLGLQKLKKSGPTGKAKRVMEEVSNLPKRQQEKILDVVDAFVIGSKTG